WSADGKWLYFLSDRMLETTVRSPWGPRQPDPHFSNTMKVYELALLPGLRSPFLPADELHPDSSPPAESKTGDEHNLQATDKRLCWLSAAADHNGPDDNQLQCLAIDNKGEKPDTVLAGVRVFELSADRKKMLIRQKDDF